MTLILDDLDNQILGPEPEPESSPTLLASFVLGLMEDHSVTDGKGQ